MAGGMTTTVANDKGNMKSYVYSPLPTPNLAQPGPFAALFAAQLPPTPFLTCAYMRQGFVCKVDMSTGHAIWATDVGLRVMGIYTRATATTAAGHVLVSANAKLDGINTGLLGKYDGSNGAHVWSMAYNGTSVLSSVDAIDEIAYTSGLFKGFHVDPFETGAPLTSSSNGTRSDAFIASLDVSSSTRPAPKWVFQIGPSSGRPAVVVSGDFLFVAGALQAASVIGTCPLTGEFGGYLVKLDRQTGSCLWAKDTPPIQRVVSDGSHVWTVQSSSKALTFDANHTLESIGKEDDVFVAKYRVSDGVGLWAAVIGGTGDDKIESFGMTPSGSPILVGSSRSESISLGDLTISNLHHQTAEAVEGFDPDTSHAQNAAQQTLFAMLLATTDKVPSCITCPSGELTASDTTIASGTCFAHGECVADGAFSHAHSPAMSCLKCVSANSQTELAAPDLSSHCYFDDICHPAGERAPAYNWQNEARYCAMHAALAQHS